MELSKAVAPASVHPGGQATYTFTVHNRGPGQARGVMLTDPLPAGVFFQAAHTHDVSCAITASGLICHLGTLRHGASAQVVVTASVRSDAAGTIENVAVVSARPGDAHWADNTARAALHVRRLAAPSSADPGVQPVSDLVLTKHVDRGVARLGQRLRYTITVTNHGPHAATDVRVTDTPSLPARILRVHPGQGHCQTGPPVACALGTLRAGAHTTIVIIAVARTAGEQVNTAAEISASRDPHPSSNVAAARTRIIGPSPTPPTPPTPPRVTG